MANDFQVAGLPMNYFAHLFALPSEELSQIHAKILIVDKNPGFPCRVSLVDAEIGERVIILPYVHHNVTSPYRSSGPIFVREKAQEAKLAINEVPTFLESRLLSIRAYDANAMLIMAEVIDGKLTKDYTKNSLKNDNIAYLHVHHARPGCYSCCINRV